MKLLTTKGDLAHALRTVSPAINSHNSHPILGCVLFDARNGGMTLTGFNMDIGISITTPAMVEKNGSLAMPYKLLANLVNRFEDDDAISIEDNLIKTSDGAYKIPSHDALDYPALPVVEAESTELLLSDGVKACLPCSSRDASKQILQGIHMANGYMEATDGHRMMRYAVDLPNEVDLVLPANTMRLIQDQTVTIATDKGQAIIVTDEGITIYSRTLDGKYPDLVSLIPVTFEQEIEVDRHRLSRCLERVAIVAEEHNSVIKVKANDGVLEITAEADALNGAEFMPYFGEGKGTWAFNVNYVLDALKAFRRHEYVLFMANSEKTPVVIKPKAEVDQTYLVMPVQVRQ